MFAYCANNPANCYDPSGAKLVIFPLGGSSLFDLTKRLYQAITFAILSRLTDDELTLDYNTGKVTISQKSDLPEKEVGTNLIRALCDDDNTILIGLVPGPVFLNGEYVGSCTSVVGTCRGERDSIIILDPAQISGASVGPEIILGHELIHAYHNATNTTAWSDWYQEVCQTVGLAPYVKQYFNENALRAENGYPNRTEY